MIPSVVFFFKSWSLHSLERYPLIMRFVTSSINLLDSSNLTVALALHSDSHSALLFLPASPLVSTCSFVQRKYKNSLPFFVTKTRQGFLAGFFFFSWMNTIACKCVLLLWSYVYWIFNVILPCTTLFKIQFIRGTLSLFNMSSSNYVTKYRFV